MSCADIYDVMCRVEAAESDRQHNVIIECYCKKITTKLESKVSPKRVLQP